MSSKKEQLKDKVVTLVKDFVKTEGSITIEDLEDLFGFIGQHEIATALLSVATVNFLENAP